MPVSPCQLTTSTVPPIPETICCQRVEKDHGPVTAKPISSSGSSGPEVMPLSEAAMYAADAQGAGSLPAEADLRMLRRAEEIRSQPSRLKVAVQIANEDIGALEKIKGDGSGGGCRAGVLMVCGGARAEASSHSRAARTLALAAVTTRGPAHCRPSSAQNWVERTGLSCHIASPGTSL